MSDIEVHAPAPTNATDAYDYAVKHGRHTISQYLAIGNHIRNHAPNPQQKLPEGQKLAVPSARPLDHQLNVLIFGAGYDTAYYAFMNPTGINCVFEDSDGWMTVAPMLVGVDTKDLGLVYHKVEYAEGRMQTNGSFDESLHLTDWEIILVDGNRSENARRAQCALVATLRKPETWVYVADWETPMLRKIIQEQLGVPDGFIKSIRGHKELSWAVYGGRHRNPVTKEWL